MAHFLCHLGCSHFGALLLDFYFTENIRVLKNLKILTRVCMRDLRVLYSLFYTFSTHMLF